MHREGTETLTKELWWFTHSTIKCGATLLVGTRLNEKQESTIWYKKAVKNSTSNKNWIATSEWYSLILSSYVIT